MKRAIVTGANGFIGKAMVKKLLKEGYFVYAIVTSSDTMKDIKDENLKVIVSFFDGYHDAITSCKDVDYLFHFAWQGVFGEPFKNYELQLGNAINAAKTMDYALEAGVKKFIFASTVNVLETKKLMSLEESKPRYTCIYGTSKLASEMILKTLAANKGIELNTCLIAMAYGEENYSLMVPNVAMCSLLQGISPNLIEGNGLYDLVYIDDIVGAFLAVAEKGKNLKTYYVGHSKLKTFKELFTEIGQILNPNVKMNFGAYKDENLIDYSLINTNSLFEDTGYIFQSDFKESILKTSKWLKKNNYLKKE